MDVQVLQWMADLNEKLKNLVSYLYSNIQGKGMKPPLPLNNRLNSRRDWTLQPLLAGRLKEG